MNANREVKTTILVMQMPGEVPNRYNGILFINKGTQAARIDNFPLAVGESVGWQHNQNEINTGSNRIDFPGGNTGASVWVILTFFKDVEH